RLSFSVVSPHRSRSPLFPYTTLFRSWPPVLAALGTAGFFLLLTVKLMVPAALFGALALAMILRWLWDADPAPDQAAVDVGGGLRLPMSCTGSSSHSWWAMVMLIMVCASIFASLLFAYFFLWTVSPEAWPDAGPFGAWSRPLGSSALLIAGSACIWAGSRALRRGRQSWLRVGLPAGCAL